MSDVRYYRKVIRIKAEDSPNVRLALAERAAGLTPSGKTLVPGVLSWELYCQRRATWPVDRQTVGLDAEFYEGPQVMMFPEEWLRAALLPDRNAVCQREDAECIGVDPAQGGDDTAMAAVNRYGVKEIVSRKTPNTTVIRHELAAFGARHDVPPDRWVVDAGGGGKQLADEIKASTGAKVRLVAFGEPIAQDIKRGLASVDSRVDVKADKYAYFNRRAELYWELRLMLDPGTETVNGLLKDRGPFAIPSTPEGLEFVRQVSPVPVIWAEERVKMLPKNKPPRDADGKESTVLSWEQLIGCSPDEADAVVLGLHGILHKKTRMAAGSF